MKPNKKIVFSMLILFFTFTANLSYAKKSSEENEMSGHMGHDMTMQQPAKIQNQTIKLNINKIENKGDKKIVQIQLSRIKDSKPISLDDLKEVHTRKVHLLIIDDTLEDYSHIHPVPTEIKGVYEFEWSPKKTDNYKIWADLFPLDSNAQEFVRAELVAGKTQKTEINRKQIMEEKLGNYKFKLSFDSKNLQVDSPTMGTIVVTDLAGKPVKNLAPVMGAYAHIVGFHDDIKSVVHVHPMGQEPAKATDRGGPELQFHMTPEKKGFVKLFAQVNIQGQELFVPFSVNVN